MRALQNSFGSFGGIGLKELFYLQVSKNCERRGRMMIEALNFLDSWLVLRDWDWNSVRVGGRHDGCGGMGGSMDAVDCR